MKKSLFTLLLMVLFTAGCSTLHMQEVAYSDDCGYDDDSDCLPLSRSLDPAIVKTPVNLQPNPNQWQATPLKRGGNRSILNKYISNLATDLTANLSSNYISAIAVGSFVNLDSSLQTTHLAGNQISEEMLTELKLLGLPVVDFKATGFIKVDSGGDYIFSRKAKELKTSLGINNVLSGTLVWHEGGLIINARIIDLNNNNVLAAARAFIPYYVADHVFAAPNHQKYYGASYR